MREVLGSGTIGCLLLAVGFCTLAGCVLPSRETLKEPGWHPATSAGTTSNREPGRTALIKPFIPPESNESSRQGLEDPAPGPALDAPHAAPQGNAAKETPVEEVPLNVPLPPAPYPVKWQQPPEGQPAGTQRQADTQASQVAAAPDGPMSGMAKRTDAREDTLVKAEIPPSPPPPSTVPQAQNYPKGPQPTDPGATVKPQPPPQPRSAQLAAPTEAKSGSREWEDQRVKEAAFKISRNFPGVKKGKICYSVKNDEWWIVLYDEAGSAYDVKQYVWNRDQEKLDPFLVLKRIGKNRLDEVLASRESDKACEPLDFSGPRN
jgi:hypothetical protein